MSSSSSWFLAFVLIFQPSVPELFLLFDDAFHIPVVKPLVTLYFPLDLFYICKRKGNVKNKEPMDTSDHDVEYRWIT